MLIKTAISISEVLRRSTGLVNGRGCSARLKSYFPQQDLWRFQVNCHKKESKSSGWEVNIWVDREDNKAPGQLNFKATCACPAWVYWGSDYHAKTKDFLYGNKKGPGTFPKVRDPKQQNLVCKHVYLALTEMMKGKTFFNVEH